jgi:hypothetical protein
MSVYVIRNTATREWWSNADGWGSFRTASVFTPKASEVFNLPLEGEWVEWSKSGLKSGSDEFSGERISASMEDMS